MYYYSTSIFTVTMRKAIEHINIVFDANSNSAMYVYRISIFSENCIILLCFRMILFVEVTIDSSLFSIFLGTSCDNQLCRISTWPPICKTWKMKIHNFSIDQSLSAKHFFNHVWKWFENNLFGELYSRYYV